MTILHLIQRPQLRGAEVFAAQLATHTEMNGHKVIIIALVPGNAPLPFAGKIIGLGGKLQMRFWDIKAWRRLAQIIKEEKPDLVQANAGDTLKYAVFSKLTFRWKQPIVFRNASTISLYIKSQVVKRLNSFLFNNVEKIVSVSHASAADFTNMFPQCKNRTTIVPIGIEENQVQSALHRAAKTIASPALLHVGGFTFEKNHHRLLHIFCRLLSDYPNACLHLVGDGPLKADIEAQARKMGIGDKVIFYGSRRDVMHLMQSADMLVLPSVIEGLPGVILEAFYYKIPVVAYNVGGIGEVVINQQTGCLVPGGDEETFLQAIYTLIGNKDLRETLVSNAHRLVTENYLNKMIARQFIEVYESVLE